MEVVNTSVILQMMRNRVFEVEDEYYLYLNEVEYKLTERNIISITEWMDLFKASGLPKEEHDNFYKIWVESYVRYHFFREALKDLPNTTDLGLTKTLVAVDDFAYPAILKLKLAYVYGNKIPDYDLLVTKWVSNEHVLKWIEYKSYRKLDEYWDMEFASDISVFESILKYNRSTLNGLDHMSDILRHAETTDQIRHILWFYLYYNNSVINPRVSIEYIIKKRNDYIFNEDIYRFIRKILEALPSFMVTLNSHSLLLALSLGVIQQELGTEDVLLDEDIERVEFEYRSMSKPLIKFSNKVVSDYYCIDNKVEDDGFPDNVFTDPIKKRYIIYTMRHCKEFSERLIQKFINTSKEEFTETEFYDIIKLSKPMCVKLSEKIWIQTILPWFYLPVCIRNNLDQFCNVDELLMRITADDLVYLESFYIFTRYWSFGDLSREIFNSIIIERISNSKFISKWYSLMKYDAVHCLRLLFGKFYYKEMISSLMYRDPSINPLYSLSNDYFNFYLGKGSKSTFHDIFRFKLFLESRLYGNLISNDEVRDYLRDYPEYITSAFNAIVGKEIVDFSHESMDLILDFCFVYCVTCGNEDSNDLTYKDKSKLYDNMRSTIKELVIHNKGISNKAAANIFFGKKYKRKEKDVMENQHNTVTDELIKDVLNKLEVKSNHEVYQRENDYKLFRGPYLLSPTSFLARLIYIYGKPLYYLEPTIKEILKEKGLIKEPWLHEEERNNIYECMSPQYILGLFEGIFREQYSLPDFKALDILNSSVQHFAKSIKGCNETLYLDLLKVYIVSNMGKINLKDRNKLILSERLLQKGNWADCINEILISFKYICEESFVYLMENSNVLSSMSDVGVTEAPYLIFEKAYQESILENSKIFGESVPDISVYKFRDQIFNEFDAIPDDPKCTHEDMDCISPNNIIILSKCAGFVESLEGNKVKDDFNKYLGYRINSLPMALGKSSPMVYSIYAALFTVFQPKYIGDMNYYILSDKKAQISLYGDMVVENSDVLYSDFKSLLTAVFKVNSDKSIRKCFWERLESEDKYEVLTFCSFIKMYTFLIESENRFPAFKEHRYDLLRLFVNFCTIRANGEDEVLDISCVKDNCIKYITSFIKDNVRSTSVDALNSCIHRLVDYFKPIRFLSRNSLGTFIKSVLCIDNFENGYPFLDEDTISYQYMLEMNIDSDSVCDPALAPEQVSGLWPVDRHVGNIHDGTLNILWKKISNDVLKDDNSKVKTRNLAIVKSIWPDYMKYADAFTGDNLVYPVTIAAKLAIFTGNSFESLVYRLDQYAGGLLNRGPYMFRSLRIHKAQLSKKERDWVYKISCERLSYRDIIQSYLQQGFDAQNKNSILSYLLIESIFMDKDDIIDNQRLYDIILKEISTKERELFYIGDDDTLKQLIWELGFDITINSIKNIFYYWAAINGRSIDSVDLTPVYNIINRKEVSNKSAADIFFGKK